MSFENQNFEIENIGEKKSQPVNPENLAFVEGEIAIIQQETQELMFGLEGDMNVDIASESGYLSGAENVFSEFFEARESTAV